mmetsp:Transcript_9546/g.27289  ORF Transcript_9546/g.27289 Transcript_9546/m.27289 type:complete len:214 (+) Transcript_9546:375-1016(+)
MLPWGYALLCFRLGLPRYCTAAPLNLGQRVQTLWWVSRKVGERLGFHAFLRSGQRVKVLQWNCFKIWERLGIHAFLRSLAPLLQRLVNANRVGRRSQAAAHQRRTYEDVAVLFAIAVAPVTLKVERARERHEGLQQRSGLFHGQRSISRGVGQKAECQEEAELLRGDARIQLPGNLAQLALLEVATPVLVVALEGPGASLLPHLRPHCLQYPA